MPCSSREDPWQEQPPPRPAESLPAGRTKPPAPPLPPDTLGGLPVAGFKAAPAHRPPNKAPPPALPPPADSRVPSDSGGSAAWPPPHPPPKAPPAAPDPPAKSPPPDPRSVAFPAPLGRTRVEDPPRAETEATRAQPPPKAPTWTPPPSGVGNLDPVFEGDESALSEDTSPELPVSQGVPVVLGAPQAAPTPPVPVSTLTGPALFAGLSQVTPRALPPFSPGPAGSLQGVISGGPRSDPSADAAAGQHTEAREAASEFSASMGGQPLALAAFPVLSADLDALALLLEGFWLEGEGRAHAACHMIHDGLLVWARDSNPPSTVIPEGRGAFRVAGAGRPEVRGRIMADGNYILIAGYPPWRRWIVPAAHPPLLDVWTEHTARTAVQRANTMLQAPPFEGRSLQSIRMPRPPSSSDSSSSASDAGPDPDAQQTMAPQRPSEPEAGTDPEAHLLQAIQHFLAAAGRRPLTVSLDPSERVVVQIVCHVHTAV
jgi:hypothetical protein